MSAWTDWMGRDRVEAYVRMFLQYTEAKNVDREGDGGVDVLLRLLEYGFQVKGCWELASQFLAYAEREVADGRKPRLIPMVVGDPGSDKETIHAVLFDGLWVGPDVPNRQWVHDDLKGRMDAIRDRCVVPKPKMG